MLLLCYCYVCMYTNIMHDSLSRFLYIYQTVTTGMAVTTREEIIKMCRYIFIYTLVMCTVRCVFVFIFGYHYMIQFLNGNMYWLVLILIVRSRADNLLLLVCWLVTPPSCCD